MTYPIDIYYDKMQENKLPEFVPGEWYLCLSSENDTFFTPGKAYMSANYYWWLQDSIIEMTAPSLLNNHCIVHSPTSLQEGLYTFLVLSEFMDNE